MSDLLQARSLGPTLLGRLLDRLGTNQFPRFDLHALRESCQKHQGQVRVPPRFDILQVACADFHPLGQFLL